MIPIVGSDYIGSKSMEAEQSHVKGLTTDKHEEVLLDIG
jgi:hypothetical protein